MANMDPYQERMHSKNEQQAQEVVSTLETGDIFLDPAIERVDVHGADVTVLLNTRTIPAGFMDWVSEYGDVRVEGTRGSRTELLIQI